MVIILALVAASCVVAVYQSQVRVVSDVVIAEGLLADDAVGFGLVPIVTGKAGIDCGLIKSFRHRDISIS